MRQYAEEGSDLIVGEIFGVERAARAGRGELPEDRLPDGLVVRPLEAESLRSSTTSSTSRPI